MTIGIAQNAFDTALEYSTKRNSFGAPIAKLQLIQSKLADMALKIETARLLIYKSAALKDAGRPYTKEVAMAKLAASETATFVAHQSIQVSVMTVVEFLCIASEIQCVLISIMKVVQCLIGAGKIQWIFMFK